MKLFGVCGWSGSGKTVLVEAMLPALIDRGLSVSTIKHTHHGVDLDRPGKDSFRHRSAGATEVVLVSPSRWTLIHELRGAAEPAPDMLLDRLAPVDLVIVEGFKTLAHDKLEVHRPGLGRPLLAADDPSIVAVASDADVAGATVPVLDLNRPDAVAAFVAEHCGFVAASL